MPILIFSYGQYRLNNNTNILANTNNDTDLVLADTDMIKADIHISVSVFALDFLVKTYFYTIKHL